MNFNIYTKYTNVIQQFAFIESLENPEISVSPTKLDQLVQEISEKIITASQIRPYLIQSAGRNLSLLDICYLTTQSLDEKHGKDTVAKIQNASLQDKAVLEYVVKKLSESFVQLPKDNVKAAALLFGIESIQELTHPKIISVPKATSVAEQMETNLIKLKGIRAKYQANPENLSESNQKLLANIDLQITQASATLEKLKTEEMQKVDQAI